MDIDEVIRRLEQSKTFHAWSLQHQGAYLAHLFCMIGDGEQIFQAGYAHDGLITVFVLDKTIKELPADKPFDRPGTTVPKLDLTRIKINLDSALDAAAMLQKEKYPSVRPSKTIVILQTIDGRAIYNITYVATSLKTLNIRVAADDGKIVSDQLVNFFSMEKGTPK